MFHRNEGSYRVTQRHIPEDDILHSHRRENLESDDVLRCIVLQCFDTIVCILFAVHV
jgi:hypothetical protein